MHAGVRWLIDHEDGASSRPADADPGAAAGPARRGRVVGPAGATRRTSPARC